MVTYWSSLPRRVRDVVREIQFMGLACKWDTALRQFTVDYVPGDDRRTASSYRVVLTGHDALEAARAMQSAGGAR